MLSCCNHYENRLIYTGSNPVRDAIFLIFQTGGFLPFFQATQRLEPSQKQFHHNSIIKQLYPLCAYYMQKVGNLLATYYFATDTGSFFTDTGSELTMLCIYAII